MKKKNIILSAIIILTIIFSIGIIAFSEPGSQDDPLVTLSYVEKQVREIKAYVDQKTANSSSSGSTLVVVEIESGQSIVGKAGTEIILRGGKATTIAGELGGLSDITDGKDLKMGERVPANHMLIVPRDDGRGVYAETHAIFMIRGEYEINY